MIKKLKKKFIILATVSMLVLMTVLILVMNLVNYRTVVVESDKVLNILKETSERMDGGFPPDGPRKDGEERDWDEKDWDDDMRGQGGMFGLSPEAQYEARFFEAEISADGQVVRLDTSRIIAVDSDDAEEYIQKALGSRNEDHLSGLRAKTGSISQIHADQYSDRSCRMYHRLPGILICSRTYYPSDCRKL